MRSKLGIASTLLVLVVLVSTLVQMPVLADMQGQEQEPVGTEAPETTATPEPSPDGAIAEATPTLLADPEPEGWTAGETSVSQLSPEEQAGLCGVPMEVIEWEHQQASQEPARLYSSYSYPSSLDWREFDGGDWTTAVHDQGGCASCVAFATTGAIESRLEITMGNPDLNPDLSEAHLFHCGGGTCEYGWSPYEAMLFARDTGIADEACYPYPDQDETCSACQDWQDRVVQLESWVETWDVAEMKQALADHGPFEVTMFVYTDFLYYTGGIYTHTSGEVLGAHAVTIVGYNDDEGYWIAKNSWGTGWGENGWFRIAYGDSDIDSYAYIPILPEPSFQLTTSVDPNDAGTVVADSPDCVDNVCEPGAEVELVANPDSGYQFNAWSGDISGSSNPTSIVMESDVNVVATFAPESGGDQFQYFFPLVCYR